MVADMGFDSLSQNYDEPAGAAPAADAYSMTPYCRNDEQMVVHALAAHYHVSLILR
jgi:hypothetical protein